MRRTGDLDLATSTGSLRRSRHPRKSERHTVWCAIALAGTGVTNVRNSIEDRGSRRRHQPRILRESTAIKRDYLPMTASANWTADRRPSSSEIYREADAGSSVRTCRERRHLQRPARRQGHLRQRMGNIAKAVGVFRRPREMDVFAPDQVSTLSRYYMRPESFRFRRPRSPRDAQCSLSRQPSWSSTRCFGSPMRNPTRCKGLGSHHQPRHLQHGLLGLSFAAGTNDLRESPLVELAEMLIGMSCASSTATSEACPGQQGLLQAEDPASSLTAGLRPRRSGC